MADKEPVELTREERIAAAKDFYARGYRNYVVGEFNEAAEDLSRSCELYAELYGDESEEVAIPNLFYGKTLIELAQMGENKVLALPDEVNDGNEEENQDDSDDDSENGDMNVPRLARIAEESGSHDESSSAGGSSSANLQPGPSTSTSTGVLNGNGAGPKNHDDTTDEVEEEANENLQYAWEALEIAAKIFRRLGDSHEEYLAEAHCGLGEILMENQNCGDALKDYNIAYDIYSKMDKIKVRLLAEIKYKTGLCHYSGMSYDQSIADFQKSADYMKEAIEAQKKLEQTAQIEQTIDDLTKMREDILVKIADVQESKELLMSNLTNQRDMFSSIIGGASSSDGAGSSGSSSKLDSDKPKPMDISHLIKRKKPDTPNDDCNTDTATPSPAKKSATN